MDEPSLRRIANDLLRPQNLRTLTDVVTGIFANVVATSVKEGLIEDNNPLNNDPLPTEFPHVLPLIGNTRFTLTQALGSKDVPYNQLAREYENHNKQLGARPGALFHDRTKLIRNLCSTLWEHRNTILHNYSAPLTIPRVLNLCSTILCILELAMPDADCDELKQEADAVIEQIAREVENQRQQDRMEDPEQEADPSEESDQVQMEGETDASDDRFVRIDRALEDMSSRLNEITAATERLATANRTLSDIDLNVRQLIETVPKSVRKVALYEDEIPEPPQDYDDEVISDAFPPEETPIVSISMAKDKLRELRNRISAEFRVEAWENICMVNPIVTNALEVAAKDGLAEIEEWKALPEVKKRYQSNADAMDRQLEKFGEEMMTVYRNVERPFK